MCCDKTVLRATPAIIASSTTELQVTDDTSRGPTNMSSELVDVNVLETGADGAGTVTPREETASDQSGVAGPSTEARTYQGDRRKPSLKSFIYGAFYGRRRRIRREEDTDHTFLDHHPRHLLVVGTIILALSVFDGLLAIHLINSGMREVNPLMAFLVNGNPVLFAIGKIACTAVGVVGLVLTAHMRIYRIVRASAVLYFFLFVYLALVLYELGLVRIMG